MEKPPDFEEAFSVCGGSVFLLNAFMKEWCEEKGRGLIGSNVRNFDGFTRTKETYDGLRSLEEL